MDDSRAAGPGKVGLAAGGGDDGGDKIHGGEDCLLADDVAVMILKKIAADKNILNLRIGNGDIDSAGRLRLGMRACDAGNANAKLCAGLLSCADCHLGGDRTGINGIVFDGVRLDRNKVHFGGGRVSDKAVLHNLRRARNGGEGRGKKAGGAAFGGRDVKRFGLKQGDKLLGGLRDRIHDKTPLNGRMYARVERPGFFILIEQNEEQPGSEDLEGVEKLIGCERDGEVVRFFVIDQGMDAGVGEDRRSNIDEQVGIIRREEGRNQKGNHDTDRPHEGVLDEGGDVIIGVLFLGGLGGKFHVPPGALLEVGKDTLKVIIGDEMREEHEEKEKKFDGHNHSPALTLHGIKFDSDIKNYKDKADTDKNQYTFIIILFHFSAPFDFSWLLEPERK